MAKATEPRIIYIVIDGELPEYYCSFVLSAAFSNRELADAYAAELAKAQEGQRWTNVGVYEMVVDETEGDEQ